MSRSDDIHVRAAEAALKLAAGTPWRKLTLREIVDAAGLSMTDAYGVFSSKDDVLGAIAALLDRAAADELDLDPDAAERERVFDAAMARFDAMEARRDGLVSILAEETSAPLKAALLWPRAARTARWLLELAGVDTSGPLGAARVQGFVLVLARATQAWLKDEAGDLSKTMAALDRALADVESWRERFSPAAWRRKTRRGSEADDGAEAAEDVDAPEDDPEPGPRAQPPSGGEGEDDQTP
ncbi:MAG: TetR family transcriptional regulator [Maricaulaceae bacterium]|jgi:AcrR family transcriptional regulator